MRSEERRKEWYAANRERINRLRRKLQKERYKTDAKYRANLLAKKTVYTEAKRQRCPEYCKLERLMSLRYRLREQIARHQQNLIDEEKRLMACIREIEILSKQCRGK